MRRAGVSRFGGRANASRDFRPAEVWGAVVTRAQVLPSLAAMKKALLICAAAIVILLLAGLAVVIRSGRLVLGQA